MKRRALTYLHDIRQAIDDLAEHLSGVDDSEAYAERLIVRRAVERELEIIGEAMNQLLEEFPEVVIPESRLIIGMRNRIIHGYAILDNALVFKTAKESAPELKDQIVALMEHYKNA